MNNKGFTLVEVLVSLALVSTIAIFLFQIIFIIRDIYAEKNIKSEIYIESSNISNVINKDIFNKDKDGIYIKNINKVSNDELYITYSDGTKSNIIINRDNHTITYGNYTVSILDVAKIGNIEMYYNYETTETVKNGICYIKIPITHDDYKNDFGIVITYRYNSSRTKINGEITIAPGGEQGQETCNVAANTAWTFDYTGDIQNFSAPCDGYYKLEVWGAQGGSDKSGSDTYSGGRGGYSYGNVTLADNQTIYIGVGGKGGDCNYTGGGAGGYNGGGSNSGMNNDGGGGGGATHIGKAEALLKDTPQADVYIVAGGGGGSFTLGFWSGGNSYDIIATGGYGGGTNGGPGNRRTTQNTSDVSYNSSYATQSSGNAYGQGGTISGGGWYGGVAPGLNWGSGGGGSGYIGGVTDGVTIAGNAAMPTHDGASTMTGNTGNGYAKITYMGEHLTGLNTVWNFDYTGAVQEFTAPETGTYKVELWGASGNGGNNMRGLGAYTSGMITLSKNFKLYIYAGEEGTSKANSVSYGVKSFNGGGGGNYTCYNYSATSAYNQYGGGATDVRLVSDNWDNFDSLKSRIMVAAGGSSRGASEAGTAGGGLNGYSGSAGTGATQTSAGGASKGGFGFGGTPTNNASSCNCSDAYGAGSGYYGGGATTATGMNIGNGENAAGSGSSFISGYSGCNAIAESSTSSNITHTNQPNHYSGKVFTDGVMIDGKGCNWSTGSAANCGANQPQPDGTSTAGHAGNGYAKITLVSY